MNPHFSGAVGLTGGRYSDPGVDVVLTNVNCSGEEDSIDECTADSDTAGLDCERLNAAVICQGM